MLKKELDDEIKSQLDNTNINEQRSKYVTALIHYDNYKFDNNLNESFLSQNYFNFYHSVFDNIFRKPKSTIDLESNVTNLTDITPLEYVTEDDISEAINRNCDVCYTKLNNSIHSVSTCKYCNIKSHTYCLLNFTNIITHLTPINRVTNSDTKDVIVEYEYICKICYNRKNKKKNTVRRIKCVICNNYNGIINSGDVFYHPFCSLYCYEQLSKFFTNTLMFNNPNEFSKFILSNNENNKKNSLVCVICNESEGVLIKCSNEECDQLLHPRCIINQKVKKTNKRYSIIYKYITLGDVYTRNQSGVILFKGIFCNKHNTKDINDVIHNFIINRPYQFTHFVPHIPEPNSVPLNLKPTESNYKRGLIDTKYDRGLMDPKYDRGLMDSVKKIKYDGDGSELKVNGNVSIETDEINIENEPNISRVDPIKNGSSEDTIKSGPSKNDSLKNPMNTDMIKNDIKNDVKDENMLDELFEMKVQKVLWNKLDIFNGNNAKLEGDLISQMINVSKRETLLPLNSVLFDNITSVHELNYCFQQQLLNNCSNIINLLKFIISVNSNSVDECLIPIEDLDRDKFIYILFENNINNHVLIYQIVQPEDGNSSLLNSPSQLKGDLWYIDRFNDVYNIYDDVKYIINSGNTEVLNSDLGLKLIKTIPLNHFESEILKRSILQITHYNISLLLINSSNCVSFNPNSLDPNINSNSLDPNLNPNPGLSVGLNPNSGLNLNLNNEIIGLNTINWNKIINYNINNGTPLKYEYTVNNNTEDVERNVLFHEFNYINREIENTNRELLSLKVNLSNSILNDITLKMDQNTHTALQNTINKYNKNEYNYYLLKSLEKLFNTIDLREDSKSGTTPSTNSNSKSSTIPGTTSGTKSTSKPTSASSTNSNVFKNEFNVMNLEDVDLIKRCQICFNVEENNINTLFKCSRCLVYVHKYCYNVYKKNNAEYLCNRCEHEKKQNQITFKKFSILCNLCKRGGGVFIKLSDYWFHNLCLILHYYSNVIPHESIDPKNQSMDMKNQSVDNMKNQHSDTLKYTQTMDNLKNQNTNLTYSQNMRYGYSKSMDEEFECIVCRLKIGVMSCCINCNIKFHAYCGFFQGFQFTIQNKTISVYCNNCSGGNLIINRASNYLNRDIISDKKRPTRVDPAATKPVQPPAECVICHSNNCGTYTKYIKCQGCETNCINCGLILHRHCYPFKIGTNFKCVKCVTGSTNMRCFLCLLGDDILIKHTNHTSYYHVICYILFNNKFNTCYRRYYKNLIKLNANRVDGVKGDRVDGVKGDRVDGVKDYGTGEVKGDGTSELTTNRSTSELNTDTTTSEQTNDRKYEKTNCCICMETDGLMIKCFKKNCSNRFHGNCALRNKLVLDFYTPIDYIALCQEHSLLHNAVGPNLKLLIKLRLQVLMMRDLFKDMYHQNAVLCSIIRKRKEIHNLLYPLM
ncbi:uncharacterized protein TA09110 [Theileria annulata]|uniref:Zinc finger PHD-type domain-containing protein n=1 Tax=Theileria annulata TaxID=5874 RepID=Q4U9A5_THEAN|nr:uncharacterized protein TA09110 [Theileria annulata]CAI76598.1 hypothetical protein, conserved [Theileria annulata]|eukprot:XP_953223.1 hypothetical protein, conserved [Theileria annulata]